MDIFDVAIIGSGPAGLTAAIYTSRANLKTVVLAGGKWGGQLMLTTTVENFPGFPDGIQGPELMEKMKTQAEKFGAKILLSDLTKLVKPARPAGGLDQLDKFGLETQADKFQSRAVIIATGADTVWLGLPNEQRLIGHGVSSCAPCDAFFFKDKKVAVVGGGDAAMEEALILTKFASEVTIIHRRDSFRASKIMQDRVLSNSKIKIMFNTEILDILGENKVEGLKIKQSPSNTVTQLQFDGLFVAIGHKPNSQIFGDLVEIDEKGYIIKSKTEGIFVAGDVHDHTYKQAVTAAGYGCQSAMDTEKWFTLRNEGLEKTT